MMPACRIQPQLDLQRSMISALPVEYHVVDGAFPAHDDLIEHCAQDPFACWGGCGRMRPGELEIGTELHQLLPLPLTQRRWFPCHDCRDLAFNTLHRQKRLVPAALQLAGHEAIGWIDGIVLLTCMAGLVTRLLQPQLELPLCG